MNARLHEEVCVLSAIRELYKRSRMERPIISRDAISQEIFDNSHKYPGIRTTSMKRHRQLVTWVCNQRFKQFAKNKLNCSWIITAEGLE